MDEQERLASTTKYDAAIRVKDWATASQLTRHHIPLHDQMGVTIVDKEGDRITMTMELSESVRGLLDGSIHGGILAAFADVASAFALGGSFDETEIPVTTDMHVRYYRQPRSGPLRAEATVVHRGRRLLGTVLCYRR